MAACPLLPNQFCITVLTQLPCSRVCPVSRGTARRCTQRQEVPHPHLWLPGAHRTAPSLHSDSSWRCARPWLQWRSTYPVFMLLPCCPHAAMHHARAVCLHAPAHTVKLRCTHECHDGRARTHAQPHPRQPACHCSWLLGSPLPLSLSLSSRCPRASMQAAVGHMYACMHSVGAWWRPCHDGHVAWPDLA